MDNLEIAMRSFARGILSLMCAVSILCSCTPRIEVAAPPEPITINLNVKIEHEVRVKVDKDLDEIFAKDNKLF